LQPYIFFDMHAILQPLLQASCLVNVIWIAPLSFFGRLSFIFYWIFFLSSM
jgi:hypothetical protein